MVETLKPHDKSRDRVLPDKTAAAKAAAAISNSMPDSETLLYFAGQLRKAQDARKAAAKVEAGIRKQMINAGVTMKVLAMVEEAMAEEGPEAIFQRMKEFQHYAQAFALPIGTQMQLFANPADKGGKGASFEDLQAQAFNDGRMRGLMGLDPDDQRYPSNTDLGQKHLEGWNDGQGVLHKRFIAENEKIAAEEASKKAKADEKAKRAEEREAKRAEKLN